MFPLLSTLPRLKKLHLLEREGQTGGIQGHIWLNPTSAGGRIETMVPNIFQSGGRRGMNLAAVAPPCPCCHVSMAMRVGQDVAHYDYLGGW